MSLKEYRRKRDFGRTPEPKGKSSTKTKTPRVKRGEAPLRFVIQKHMASREHFDFRLEMGGSFKSWAVPKGPSLNPLDQRLAVFVEDHPLEYGAFEGIIPEGNYGAGTVMIWDHGTFTERRARGRELDEKALLEGLEKGHITILLQGEKLSGEFAFVKLKKEAKGKAWLLLKKRDASSKFKAYEPDDRSAVSGRTMSEIEENAVAENAIWISKRKGSSPKKRQSTGKRAEAVAQKAERIRPMLALLARHLPAEGSWQYEPATNGVRAIAEKVGKEVVLYSRVLLPLEKKYPEILKALRGIRSDFAIDGEIASSTDAPGGAIFRISDLLRWDGKDLRADPLEARRKRLLQAEKKITSRWVELAPFSNDLEQAITGAKAVSARMLIAKRSDSAYQSGFSVDWTKAAIGTKLPLHRATKGKAKPDLVPSKPTRPAKLRRVNASLAVSNSQRPPLTNLTKVYWPKEKITKGDLVQYYDQVAPYILPYLIDRPESLHRQPDGIKNSGFFQKDNQGFLPRRIQTQRVYSESSQKTIHYIVCQDKWTLLYLANLGCIELHPWLSRIQDLQCPDFALIDLDPDDNNFEEVIEVALEVRKVLQSVGADAVCKTSGATGLHLYVPMQPGNDFDQVRAFAEALCRILQRKFPNNTSVERTPARRRHKIYLDFLQNRRGQTIAAPYCVRPREGAPVATPLEWREVKRGLRPEAFTIFNIPERLAKLGDVWEGWDKKRYNPAQLLAKLLKKYPESK